MAASFCLVALAQIVFWPVDKMAYVENNNLLPLKTAELRQMSSFPDILFLGTSQTNNGFHTAFFRQQYPEPITVFNFGLPSNQYELMLALLKLQVESRQSPKMLLLEASPTIMVDNSPHYGRQSRLYSRWVQDNPQLPIHLKQQLFLLAFSAAGTAHQFRQEYSPLNWLAHWTQPSLSSDWKPEMAQGWTPKPASPLMKTPLGRKKILAEAQKYFLDDLPPLSFKGLHRLIAYSQAHRIPVVLVTWPNQAEFMGLMRESGLEAQFLRGMAITTQRYQVPWINLSQPMNGSQNQLYADPRHLTPQGAKIYSSQLAKRVAALKIFPVKR